MAVSGFSVLQSSALTSLQDVGRVGFQSLGVANSGPADYLSFYWGSRLHNNHLKSPQVEIGFGGFTFTSHCATSIALTGADNQLLINNVPVPMWQTHAIKASDIVKVGRPQRGIWNYLSVRGGFQVHSTLGSVATSTREKLGGLNGQGQALKKGDVLPVLPSKHRAAVKLDKAWQPNFVEDKVELSLVPNAHYFEFSKKFRKAFLSAAFSINPSSNKMGVRLSCNQLSELPLLPESLFAKPSEATAMGTIQITPAGVPIVLHTDRQTVGGYPKFGSVSLPHCWNLAQCRPGTHVSFRLTRLSSAQLRYRHLQQQLQHTKLSSC